MGGSGRGDERLQLLDPVEDHGTGTRWASSRTRAPFRRCRVRLWVVASSREKRTFEVHIGRREVSGSEITVTISRGVL